MVSGGISALALVIVALALSACGGAGSGRAAPPAGDPYIEGVVTAVTPFAPVTENCVDGSGQDPDTPVSSNDPPICSDEGAPQGSILVEEVPDGNKASLRIPQGMPIWRGSPEGDAEPAQFSDLAEGQTVAAWVSGPVAESFPVQATADALLIQHP